MQSDSDKAKPHSVARFTPERICWICGGDKFIRQYSAVFEFSAYAQQDEQLHAYTGEQVPMQRCQHCGFTQPEALPNLPNYFDRMYNQQWSHSWIEKEFNSTYKDYIFRGILRRLRQLPSSASQSLLDIGAHVGRFMFLAEQAGWRAEGVELNPLTCAYARERTGLVVHGINAKALALTGNQYRAVTLIDVLEHIPKPLSILRTAAELLEPGGWLAIKVPCGPGQQFKENVRSLLRPNYHPTARLAGNLVHISYFSSHSLRLALENVGFRQIEIKVAAPELNDLRRTEATFAQLLSNIFRLGVYHGTRLLPGAAHLPFALNLQAYARKD